MLRLPTLMLLCASTMAAVSEPRMTDLQRLQARGIKASEITLSVRHPKVLRTSIEDTKVTENVLGGSAKLRAWITLRVVLSDPIEENEIDQISEIARDAAGAYDSVGVRFVLPGWGEGDDRNERPFYAWRLFEDDAVKVSTMMGLSPRTLASQMKLELPAGDRLDGIWVDHYYENGAVALVSGVNGKRSVLFLAEPATRYWLPKLPEPDGSLVEVESESGPVGTFKADGKEADRLALKMRGDGTLLVFPSDFGVLTKKPWLIAKRWHAANTVSVDQPGHGRSR